MRGQSRACVCRRNCILVVLFCQLLLTKLTSSDRLRHLKSTEKSVPILTCKQCSAVFKNPHSRRKFCSRKCSTLAITKPRHRICSVCEVPFIPRTMKLADKPEPCCSKECGGVARSLQVCTWCDHCGARFQMKAYDFLKRKTRCCSRKCAGDIKHARARAKNFKIIGVAVTSRHESVGGSSWRLRGKECGDCGCREEDGHKMHLDHILAVVNGGTRNRANLQTLCRGCNIRKRDYIDKPLNRLLDRGIPLIEAAAKIGAPLPIYLADAFTIQKRNNAQRQMWFGRP